MGSRELTRQAHSTDVKEGAKLLCSAPSNAMHESVRLGFWRLGRRDMVGLGELRRVLLERRRASAAAEEITIPLVVGKHLLLGGGLDVDLVVSHHGALHLGRGR